MSKNIKKTNAMRLLDAQNIEYDIKEYEFDGHDYDGSKVAHQIGVPEEEVFKTLVVQDANNNREIAVAIVPVNKHLDLKLLASFIGSKKLEMIPVGNITKITGYVRGGCSPIGMKKEYPIYIDKSMESYDKIAVSAGAIGVQVYLSSKDLIKATNAELGDFTTE